VLKNKHFTELKCTFPHVSSMLLRFCPRKSSRVHPLRPQGNKDVKSPKSPMVDIPTGGARSIKSMWEKGNVGSSSDSPTPANKVRGKRPREEL